MSTAMLGALIDTLDDPAVAQRLLAALDDPPLLDRLFAASIASGQPRPDIVSSAVRSFVETAPDDLWTQLIGIMSRAEDPGLAGMHAILRKAFPPAGESVP
jgi:hypothetical protein